MDFSFTEEQRAFKQAVIEFAKRELDGGLLERDKRGEFSREGFRKCAELGVLGLAVPPEYGGAGSDILTTVMAMEGLGYGCRDNGLLFALNAQMWSVQAPIVSFGTPEQKERYLLVYGAA